MNSLLALLGGIMKEVRVIIAGGRDFNDYAFLKKSMFDLAQQLAVKYPDRTIKIVSGHAKKGADNLGERFAEEFQVTCYLFPADWSTFGKRAGFLRNIKMAKFAKEDDSIGVLLAFWDGESHGTGHMIQIAKKEGLMVQVMYY